MEDKLPESCLYAFLKMLFWNIEFYLFIYLLQIVEQLSELDWIDNEEVEPAGSEKDSMVYYHIFCTTQYELM